MSTATQSPAIVELPTWLPVFPGFYNTLFEPDLLSEFDELIREGHLPPDEKYPVGRWDNGGYELAVVRNICDEFPRWFPAEAGIEKCELESIKHPKEYNFRNDAVDVTFRIDMAKFAPWIDEFLDEHKVEFAKYLNDHYRSRDGFISYYPTDMDEWREALSRLMAGEEHAWAIEHGWRSRQSDNHILGRVLEFWCEQEFADAYVKMYYDGTENVYLGEFIDTSKPATP